VELTAAARDLRVLSAVSLGKQRWAPDPGGEVDMDEQDQAPGTTGTEQHTETRSATPSAAAGDPPHTASGPGPLPPGHLQIGGNSFLGSDPVTGSVLMDDWGPIPGGEPDMEHTAVSVLDEDATT
jgi:hypothetical protein